MIQHIDQLTRQVTDQVADGRTVAPHAPERVPARELTVEYDPEPYPEVQAAFDEFCRLTGRNGRLLGYQVRPVVGEDTIGARVTATIQMTDSTRVGHGEGDDVVTGSVRAFVDAMDARR